MNQEFMTSEEEFAAAMERMRRRTPPPLTDQDAEEITRWVGMYGFVFTVDPHAPWAAIATGQFIPQGQNALCDMVQERLTFSPYILLGTRYGGPVGDGVYVISVGKGA